MTSLTVRRAATAAAASLALVLAACGSDDVSESQFREDLVEEASLTEDQAACVTDKVYDEFDQGQINDIYTADTEEEAGDEEAARFTEIVTECVAPE